MSVHPRIHEGQRSTLDVFPQGLMTLFLETGSLIGLNLPTRLGCLAAEHIGTVDPIQVLMLVWQTLYKSNHLSP